MRTLNAFLTCLGVLLCVADGAVAQAAHPDGGPSPDAAPDLVRLGYLIGEWSVQGYTRNESGDFVEDPYTSLFRARFLRDGLGIFSEFYEENPDGFYGIHVITHDSERGLVDRYFNARAERRLEFTGRFEGDTYELTREGGYGGGDFVYREVDSQITTDSFVKRIYRSEDGGRTWVEGDFMFRFRRLG